MNAITPIAETSDTVTLSRADYEAILSALDDQGAQAAYAATRDEETFPAEIVARLVSGENPVKVYRAHRGLSVRALAEASGLSATLISDIENRKLTGSVAALKTLAAALGVDLDDIA